MTRSAEKPQGEKSARRAGGKRCGEFGGLTHAGQPCRMRVIDGRCNAHCEKALDEMAATKAAFLEAYGEMPVKTEAVRTLALQGITTSIVTIWRLRKTDPAFDAALKEIEEVAPDVRYAMLEDCTFMKVVNGNASAALEIFYLINESRRRGDKRWMDVRFVEHGGRVGVYGAIQQLPPEEVLRILTLPDDERQDELLRLLQPPPALLPPPQEPSE